MVPEIRRSRHGRPYTMMFMASPVGALFAECLRMIGAPWTEPSAEWERSQAALFSGGIAETRLEGASELSSAQGFTLDEP